MKFVKTGNLAGCTELYVNGKLVGQDEIPHAVAIPFGVDETFAIGQDTATAVSQHCKGAFRCNGQIDKVTVTLDHTPDPQSPTSTGGKAVID
jgi:hypothetical protein